VSVYRDMLKKIESQPGETSLADPVVGAPAPVPSALQLPALDGMKQDLESLSSQLEQLTDRLRSITFCGVDEGVGVSSIALSIAVQLAELHPGEVILLDVNSRSQRASLIEHESSADSFYQFQQSENGTGIAMTGPLHLLSARASRQALGRMKAKDLISAVARLKERYRWVLVDAPPVNHPESLIWTTITDGTILVVESGRTRRHSAQAMAEQLRNLQVNIIGCVLNRRRLVIPEWIYRLLFK
jgi:Mrp family chromosome partitioning ATPase